MKDYNNCNILFYQLLGDDSLTYFLKKVGVLTVQALCMLTICLIGVSIVFHDFSAFFQTLYIFFIVMVQYILIISVISLYANSTIISVASAIAFWLASTTLITIGGALANVGFFDASNSFYASVTAYLQSSDGFLPLIDNLHATLFISILFFTVLIAAFAAKKVWLKQGT